MQVNANTAKRTPVRVFLDDPQDCASIELTFCCWQANDEEGWADCFDIIFGHRLYQRTLRVDESGEPISRRIYGHVRIEPCIT